MPRRTAQSPSRSVRSPSKKGAGNEGETAPEPAEDVVPHRTESASPAVQNGIDSETDESAPTKRSRNVRHGDEDDQNRDGAVRAPDEQSYPSCCAAGSPFRGDSIGSDGRIDDVLAGRSVGDVSGEYEKKFLAVMASAPPEIQRLYDPKLHEATRKMMKRWLADHVAPLCATYGPVVPTSVAVGVLAALSPLVEIEAGAGYWAMLVRRRGAVVYAYSSPARKEKGDEEDAPCSGTDDEDEDDGRVRSSKKRKRPEGPDDAAPPCAEKWSATAPGDGQLATQTHGWCTLFACMPPKGSRTLFDALQTHRGEFVAVVLDRFGESPLGAVGDSGCAEDRLYLAEHFHPVLRLPLPAWPGSCPELVVYQRSGRALVGNWMMRHVPPESRSVGGLASPLGRSLLRAAAELALVRADTSADEEAEEGAHKVLAHLIGGDEDVSPDDPKVKDALRGAAEILSDRNLCQQEFEAQMNHAPADVDRLYDPALSADSRQTVLSWVLDRIEPLRRQFSRAIPTQVSVSVLSLLSPLVEIDAGSGYWSMLLRKRGAVVHPYAPAREEGGDPDQDEEDDDEDDSVDDDHGADSSGADSDAASGPRSSGRKSQRRNNQARKTKKKDATNGAKRSEEKWTSVQEGGASLAVSRHPRCTLFACMPPKGSRALYDALQTHRGEFVAVVLDRFGESPLGAVGDSGCAEDRLYLAEHFHPVLRLPLPAWPGSCPELVVYQRSGRTKAGERYVPARSRLDGGLSSAVGLRLLSAALPDSSAAVARRRALEVRDVRLVEGGGAAADEAYQRAVLLEFRPVGPGLLFSLAEALAASLLMRSVPGNHDALPPPPGAVRRFALDHRGRVVEAASRLVSLFEGMMFDELEVAYLRLVLDRTMGPRWFPEYLAAESDPDDRSRLDMLSVALAAKAAAGGDTVLVSPFLLSASPRIVAHFRAWQAPRMELSLEFGPQEVGLSYRSLRGAGL